MLNRSLILSCGTLTRSLIQFPRAGARGGAFLLPFFGLPLAVGTRTHLPRLGRVFFRVLSCARDAEEGEVVVAVGGGGVGQEVQACTDRVLRTVRVADARVSPMLL
jgi:hypothetical protein